MSKAEALIKQMATHLRKWAGPAHPAHAQGDEEVVEAWLTWCATSSGAITWKADTPEEARLLGRSGWAWAKAMYEADLRTKTLVYAVMKWRRCEAAWIKATGETPPDPAYVGRCELDLLGAERQIDAALKLLTPG